MELFVENGLDETTVAEIAERADVGKGTFFAYFPTKEAVFADVSEMLVQAMDRGLEAAVSSGAPFAERILAFFRPALDWHAANPVLSRYMLSAFMRDTAFVQAERLSLNRLYQRLASELAEAQAGGAITPDVELGSAITAIAGTYFGTLGAWHGAETRTALAADFARSLQIVIRGLRP